ncbi:DNA-3-methyladenine glycosylase I [Stappia sp. F7233]|uniref:DNA-3-methyladenine glycosylase I n=1 Tax=Stappia albiluteola TaxID=2758565 RepID=A0A839AET3_9HYPH|nr:DNA-3-methyladenine glycosylase I [Stappia albiluteola]MBA5778203.1 DNA-3-methyladenine glycosylase I [Stappia albiluteola]
MRSFAEIREIAAARKGGEAALDALLLTPRSAGEIRATPADRWLSEMTRCVFQAGFSWSLINKKWPGFEDAFEGFDIFRWTLMSDEDIDRLARHKDVIANVAKIQSVGTNAQFLAGLEREHGSAGAFFAAWEPENYVELLQVLKARGSRLGGNTGQIFLRRMGVDALVFSKDVVAALQRESIVARAPSSQKDFKAAQAALNEWRAETRLPLTQISQILAFSVGE